MSGAPARVLIVDDSPDDLEMYSRWLLACVDRSFSIAAATSLAGALEQCQTFGPDCILLDYDLGDSTGLEVMAELRRQRIDVPVIAITGNGNEAIAVEFMKAGARDYFTKSGVTASELCSVVVAQLSPYTLRRQLTLYRERERNINAELATALERMSFLAETGKLLAATFDYGEVLNLAVTRALPFLAEACMVDVFEDRVLRRRRVRVLRGPALGDARELTARPPLEPTGRTIPPPRARQATYLTGAELTSIARDDADIAALCQAGLTSAAVLPLSTRGPALGVLSLLTSRTGGFTRLERSLCEDYAQRVAVALTNVRIVESEHLARERAEAAQRRLTFQSHVNALFAQSLDWRSAARKLMKLLTASFCDSAMIFTVDGASRQIAFEAAAAPNAALQQGIAEYYTAHPPRLTDACGAGYAVRTGRSQYFAADVFAPTLDPGVAQRQRDLLAAWNPVAAISVPLQVKGLEVGLLTLVRDVSRAPFTRDDVTVAEDLARRTATFLENARSYEREHRIAFALQQALLPSELPSVSDVLFGVRYFPGAVGMDVGGDWYDIVEDGERLVITIGDVVGRGLNAAVAMGRYRDILRAYTFDGYGAAAALTRLNDLVHALRGEAYATCIIVILNRQTRRIHYASAGHPPAMLRRADGTVQVLDGASAMPIGAWPGTVYTEKTIEMPVGATLVLYTDGLVETRHRSASQGVEVLREALRASPADIELMLDSVLSGVAPDRSDDVAMLAVELLPLQSATLKRWGARRIDPPLLRAIRAEFDALLARYAADDSDCQGSRLILGELLSNVVRHAPGPFRLELDWSAEYLELRLYDSGSGFTPQAELRAPQDVLSMTGRGLFLISQFSRSITMSPRPSGGLATIVVLPVKRKTEAFEPELVLR